MTSSVGAHHVNGWNENPKPFIWAETAGQILDSLARLLQVPRRSISWCRIRITSTPSALST